MYYKTSYLSPVGELTLAGDDERLIGLWIVGQKYYGAGLPDDVAEEGNAPVFARAEYWLDRYFAGEKPLASEFALAPAGSDFRQVVWRILCDIPYGEVLSYGDIAEMMASKTGEGRTSARAVGGAVGHNPISIIIPCHRVVGANGNLTGYAGGVGTKARLLEHEGVQSAGGRVREKGQFSLRVK
jgi:methylated-DNA-[protein]-cysteine S-methyltransferase